MFILLYLGLGASLTVLVFFALKRRAAYREVTLYEVPDGMLPVERERLLEIYRESQPASIFVRNSCAYRRQLRLDLECLRDRFYRILSNAQKAGDCAATDLRLIKKHKLECPPDAQARIREVLDAGRELRNLVHGALVVIWLWSLAGFHRREWGPVPNVQHFPVLKIVEAYERVKLAAINLARCYGEAGVAEEIAAVM